MEDCFSTPDKGSSFYYSPMRSLQIAKVVMGKEVGPTDITMQTKQLCSRRTNRKDRETKILGQSYRAGAHASKVTLLFVEDKKEDKKTG